MAKNSARRRVLVVDDEALIRWSVSETLVEHGYEVVEAGDGESALEALAADPAFAAVVLDFRLPDSNDLRLLARVRHLSPDARVVLMTAYGTPDVVQGALDLGACHVVSKPFEMNDLAGLIAADSPRPA